MIVDEHLHGRKSGRADARAAPDDGVAYDTIILPHRGWFDWRLAQLWRYRDLIGLFVWRDFVTVYKQTILGPAWHLIQPLVTTVIFTIVFGRVAALSTDGTSPFLFYMCGYIAWSYFAGCLESTSKTFVANVPLLSKVYFHRIVIPLSLALSNLISLVIRLTLLLVILGLYAASGARVELTGWIWVTPVLIIMLAGFGMGAGIIACALTTRFRDLQLAVTFGVQMMMYVTPVIYPTSAVPHAYRWVALLNPLTPVIEAFRLAFLGVGTVSIYQLTTSFGVMLTLLVCGLLMFSRVERNFLDTV